MRANSLGSIIGLLAFLAAAAFGVYWGFQRAEPRPPRAQAGSLMLRTPAGDAAVHHRHSFTLGAPSHVTVVLQNPDRVKGVLLVGPPQASDKTAFDPDPDHTRRWDIPPEERVVFSWKDLAVGTRIVDVRFATSAPVGLDIETQRDE